MFVTVGGVLEAVLVDGLSCIGAGGGEGRGGVEAGLGFGATQGTHLGVQGHCGHGAEVRKGGVE